MASGDDAKAIAEYVAGGLKGEAPDHLELVLVVMDQMEQEWEELVQTKRV